MIRKVDDVGDSLFYKTALIYLTPMISEMSRLHFRKHA